MQTSDTPAATTPEVKPPTPPPSIPWGVAPRDDSSLVESEIIAPVEIVKGLLTEQCKLLIGGAAKTHKTWLTMDLALSIAYGIPFLGHECKRNRVLYINLELRDTTFKFRLHKIRTARGIVPEPDRFCWISLRGKMADLDVKEFVRRTVDLACRIEARVVIIDPIYKAFLDGDENSSKDQTRFCNHLDRITTDAKCVLIVCDHFPKGSQALKEPLDAIRGSSAKVGDMDAIMVMRKHKEANCASVHVTHRELPAVEPFCVEWNPDLLLMNPRHDLDPSDMVKPLTGHSSENREKSKVQPVDLLASLPANGTPISTTAWSKASGVARTTLQKRESELVDAGWVTFVGENSGRRVQVTEAGRKALQNAMQGNTVNGN